MADLPVDGTYKVSPSSPPAQCFTVSIVSQHLPSLPVSNYIFKLNLFSSDCFNSIDWNIWRKSRWQPWIIDSAIHPRYIVARGGRWPKFNISSNFLLNILSPLHGSWQLTFWWHYLWSGKCRGERGEPGWRWKLHFKLSNNWILNQKNNILNLKENNIAYCISI